MYMLELTIYGGIGITKWESIIKYYGSPPNIMVMLVISDCRKYYSILRIPKSPFISACHVSWHYQLSRNFVYFSLPNYHGIIGIIKSPFTRFANISRQLVHTIEYFISSIVAYIGLINYPDSSVLSFLIISVHQNRRIVVPVQAFMSFQLELAA